jgi:hypothetical protein
MAHRKIEVIAFVRRGVALGRTTSSGASSGDSNLEVAAGGELVEVMAGDIGMQIELSSHL